MSKLHTMTTESLHIEDHHRWYLCIQMSPQKWSCSRATQERALELILHKEKPDAVTKAIAVNPYLPRIFDPFIIHKKLHPHIRLSM